MIMPSDRWIELMNDSSLSLTEEEIAQGWHFCSEWDGLLIGPGMSEYDDDEFCSHKKFTVKI